MPQCNVKFSPKSKEDLSNIYRYITEELCSPVAGRATLEKIFAAVARIETFPDSGSPLGSLLPISTNRRFVVAAHYLVFYRHVGNDVFVDRILYAGSDYMNALLS